MGMAVYMMNGNHEKYPRRVVLHLEPTSFANVGARDFWYARYRQYIEIKWQRTSSTTFNRNAPRGSGESGNCKDGVTKARSAREQELQYVSSNAEDAPH